MTDITVRTYEPEDREQVIIIFRDGLAGLIPTSAFRSQAILLRTFGLSNCLAFAVITSVIIESFTVLLLKSLTNRALLMSIPIMLSTIVLIWYLIVTIAKLIIKFFILKYIKDSMEADLEDIGKYYSNENRLWVAVDNRTNQVVGCVGVERKDGYLFELKRMSVRKDMRRRGVGVSLMKELIKYCDGQCKKIILGTSSVQEPAIALYLKFGFKLISEKIMPGVFVANVLWFERPDRT
jgi:GNAT superfamily N-acetyltransferase